MRAFARTLFRAPKALAMMLALVLLAVSFPAASEDDAINEEEMLRLLRASEPLTLTLFKPVDEKFEEERAPNNLLELRFRATLLGTSTKEAESAIPNFVELLKFMQSPVWEDVQKMLRESEAWATQYRDNPKAAYSEAKKYLASDDGEVLAVGKALQKFVSANPPHEWQYENALKMIAQEDAQGVISLHFLAVEDFKEAYPPLVHAYLIGDLIKQDKRKAAYWIERGKNLGISFNGTPDIVLSKHDRQMLQDWRKWSLPPLPILASKKLKY